MAYKLDKSMMPWAQKRTAQLDIGIISTGAAYEHLNVAIADMFQAANEMPDQPESEMIKDYMMKVVAIADEINDRLHEWKSDRKAINKGITAYYVAEKGKKDDR